MDNLKAKFKHVFGYDEDTRLFFSPGRVNLIGEHIDYNGGLVFPAAISLGTYGVCGLSSEKQIRLYSENEPRQGMITDSLSNLAYDKSHGWANYAKGMIKYFIDHGFEIPFGFDLYVYGNLPTASGLSSSASLEVLIGYLAKTIYHLPLSRVDIAKIAQIVENEYMGMHCGIMDQLIIATGIKDKALLMNTATLETEPKNATFEGYKWVIMNTKYPRKTTDSKYNERRKECELALQKIADLYDVSYLCDLKPKHLENIKNILGDDILYRRVHHAITEQDRTLKAKEAMEKNDPLTFARLLNESHQSLKSDYEVTGKHLDILCAAAREHGAIGARVTGAGFGGCAIALVEENLVKHMERKVSEIYEQETGIKAEFYAVTFEDGVKEVK